MIKDFFSHKIHSSGTDWPDKLVELATLFHEFDSQPFDRDLIEARLSTISPRSSFIARDQSKFRDEYGAYPTYFGLYSLAPSTNGWIIKTTETTKKYLLSEEPDVPSFLRLQLSLLQYPNGFGAAYIKGTNNLRIQANIRDRTLEFVENEIHLSPLRLIACALLADSASRNIPLEESYVTFKEVFALANHPLINRAITPDHDTMIKMLDLARKDQIRPPDKFESRFHLLKHLNLFKIGQGKIQLRDFANEADEDDTKAKIHAIPEIKNQFDGFDRIKDGEELKNAIQTGAWGEYFDGIRTIRSDLIQILTNDLIIQESTANIAKKSTANAYPLNYPLRKRDQITPKPTRTTRKRELADPETTRIKRQRRNLIHKILVEQMDSRLRELGAEPMESSHIDLYAKIPNDGSFIFEMKSGGENLLSQIRKGLSQLYEYRFRYIDTLEQPVTLCMVLAEEPKSISWVKEYLCIDREIALCWFDKDGNLKYPKYCEDEMSYLHP